MNQLVLYITTLG